LALVAAGSALVASREDPAEPSPLASGLAKLADLLGIDPADAIAIRLGASRPEVLDSLRQATREQRRVRLDYFSYNRDRRTSREVDPYRVFAADGAWYVVGHCHLVDDTRTFRVDRIFRLDVLDEVFERSPSTEVASVQVFALDPAAPRVVLDLPPDGRWVVDTYPADQVVEGPDGRLSVTLPVASRAWLERLLLRLGPDTRLSDVSDPTLKASRAEAAARVLACYRDGSDG
jgi:proteasome accessory factor C